MNEKACIKCKHFHPIFAKCNKGMMCDNEIWGEKYELKYEGTIEDVRYYKCMGKDFEPIEIKTTPPPPKNKSFLGFIKFVVCSIFGNKKESTAVDIREYRNEQIRQMDEINH